MKLTRQVLRNSVGIDRDKGVRAVIFNDQRFRQYLYNDCRVLHIDNGVEIQIGISHNDRDFIRVVYHFLKENGHGQ